MVESKYVSKKTDDKFKAVDQNYTAHCGISVTLGIREILRGETAGG
jgi:hypothetical protein